MKNKGNIHQDSCIVQCPTFLCFLCLEQMVRILLFSSYSSLWLLPNGSCTLTGCHHVIITWYNNYMMWDALYIYSQRYIITSYIWNHLVYMQKKEVSCHVQKSRMSLCVICRYYNMSPLHKPEKSTVQVTLNTSDTM